MPRSVNILGHVLTGVAGLSIYVSGPVHDGPSRLALVAATRRLAAAGASVTYPHHECAGSGRAARDRNVSALLSADLLVLTPGWESSPSALIDALTADGAGIPRAPLAELENLSN